jgi:hypothetical protein
MNPRQSPSDPLSALGPAAAWRLILCLRIQALVGPNSNYANALWLPRAFNLLNAALEGADDYWNHADPSERIDWERFLGLSRMAALDAGGLAAAGDYLRSLPGWRGDAAAPIPNDNHGYLSMALVPRKSQIDSAAQLARAHDFQPASFASTLMQSIRSSGSLGAPEALSILAKWTLGEFERFELEQATAPLSTSNNAPAEREPKRL